MSLDNSTGQILQISDNCCLSFQSMEPYNVTLETCTTANDPQKWTQVVTDRHYIKRLGINISTWPAFKLAKLSQQNVFESIELRPLHHHSYVDQYFD
ncbi:putative ricin B-like lectin [Plasmopara halstedii]